MPGVGDIIQNKNFGIFGSDSTSISGLANIIDAYPEENHSFVVTKTKYPVESGQSKTDNFVVEDETLVLKGLVSDLQPLAGGLVTIPNEKRSKEAWGRIRALKNSGERVSVVTMLGVYENMIVTMVDAVLNKDTGQALFFTITLEETQIVETQIVKLPASKLSGPAATKGTEVNGGKKQAETPDSDRSTILKNIVDSVGGYFK